MITGVNLPMLIKLAELPEQADLLDVGARDARARTERHLGRVGSAARREGRERTKAAMMTSLHVTVVNPLGLHARAAARFVHLATRFKSQIRVGA